MKKRLTTLLISLIITLIVLASPVTALANGDQMRGDNAQGTANQVQVQDPPPFQP